MRAPPWLQAEISVLRAEGGGPSCSRGRERLLMDEKGWALSGKLVSTMFLSSFFALLFVSRPREFFCHC